MRVAAWQHLTLLALSSWGVTVILAAAQAAPALCILLSACGRLVEPQRRHAIALPRKRRLPKAAHHLLRPPSAV